MTSESGIGTVSAAPPVTAAEPVAARTESPQLPPPAALPPPPASPGVRAEISTAARLLSALLHHPARADIEAAPAGPLMTAATPDAPAIAGALRTGIVLSGLFYESHQAEWVAGERDIGDLRREPQARPASDTDPDTPTLPALVRQQLDMLDGQPLHWKGELWPGMALQLSITRDQQPADEQHTPASAREAADDGWQTQIVSTLPSLGRISARLHIAGDRVGIELFSAERGTSTLIATEASKLGRTLQSAGLTLASFASRHDEHA